jgi:hypothetical protein
MKEAVSKPLESVFSVGGGDPFATDLITTEPEEVNSIEHLFGTKPKAGDSSKDTSGEVVKETEKKEAPVKEVEAKKEDTPAKEGTSAAFILAESWKKEGTLPKDLEINEKITAKELKAILVENAKKEASEEIRAEYETKYEPSVLETAELLSKGIDPEDLKEVNVYKRIASLELPDDEEQALELKERAIQAMYKDKGLSDSKIKRLVEDALEEDEGESEFLAAKKHFSDKGKEIEQKLIKEAKEREDNELSTQDKITTEIKALIKSGEVYNTSNDEDKKALEDFLFSNTETIKTPEGKVLKVTPYHKKLQEYGSDLKKQLVFAKLLMNDFDLKDIETKGSLSKAEELDAILEGNLKGDNNKKSNDTRNFFEQEGMVEVF